MRAPTCLPILATVVGAGVVASATACTGDVSLGRWGPRASSAVQGQPGNVSPAESNGAGGEESSALGVTESGVGPLDASAGGEDNVSSGAPAALDAAAATGDAGMSVPECLVGLGTGVVSPVATAITVTETSTDWNLPEPTTGFEWTLTIEKDVPPQSPARTGYYWHNQFSFLPGATGILGLQSNGVYQSEPTAVPQYVHMAVFWLSGSPLDAELGDIEFPDARIGTDRAAGVDYQTIHAKFPHEVCHTYRFRVAIDETDEDGNLWYGAWITDETTGEVTLLGRMLLASDAGLISTFSTSRTSPLWLAAQSCNDLKPASAIFGAPVSVLDQTARRVASRFSKSYGCNPSLIADFEAAVRHESFTDL